MKWTDITNSTRESYSWGIIQWHQWYPPGWQQLLDGGAFGLGSAYLFKLRLTPSYGQENMQTAMKIFPVGFEVAVRNGELLGVADGFASVAVS